MFSRADYRSQVFSVVDYTDVPRCSTWRITAGSRCTLWWIIGEASGVQCGRLQGRPQVFSMVDYRGPQVFSVFDYKLPQVGQSGG